MDQNIFLNGRQRRKSNLGRRRTNGVPPSFPTFLRPVFPVPVPRSLGRSRSAKKLKPQVDKAAGANSSGVAKKRLFSLSGTSSTNTPQEQADASTKTGTTPSPSHYFTDQLDVTGIRSIETPSLKYYKSTVSSSNLSKRQGDPLPKSSSTYSWNEQKDLHTDSLMEQIFGVSKPPDSPGPSRYNQLILEEDLQPPVDPDDLLPLQNLSLDETIDSSSIPGKSVTSTTVKDAAESKISSGFSPHLSSTCVDSFLVSSGKKVNSSCVSDKKLSIIDENSDSTDFFLLTEQTIIDQNNTVTEPIASSEALSETVFENNNVNQSLVVKSESDTDEEIERVLEEVDQVMKKMASLKKKVLRLKNKRQQPKSVENKENIPQNTTTKVNMNKWIKEIKSNNPGLLKTPKLTKHNSTRFSLADQSTIWTPHSLSTVLQEQVEDLFD